MHTAAVTRIDEPTLEATFAVRNVYGQQKVYTVDATAVRLCDLAGTKTATLRTLTLIQALGYTLTIQGTRTYQVRPTDRIVGIVD